MRRPAHRRWLLASQGLLLLGLGLAVVWNTVSLGLNLAGPTGWISLLLPLPGLVSWVGAWAAPAVLTRLRSRPDRCFRLTYDAPLGWSDEPARAALLNLIRTGTEVEIIWARESEGVGCWLAVSDEGRVLQRLVADLFPGGSLEVAEPPQPGVGVVILRWLTSAGGGAPDPVALCQLEGVDGLYFRWHSEQTATVALWGPDAGAVARQFAGEADLLSGSGEPLGSPPFVGDNPWPALPPFPPSSDNPALAAVSRVERVAPALRVTDRQAALIVGLDAEQQPLGFAGPELAGMQPLHIFGQAAESVAATLADQAIRLGLPVAFLDGRGPATTRLARRLLREMATGQVLLADVERPAQSQFRLNPLWLPRTPPVWPAILSGGWLAWLRDLGVTPGGLGQVAYRHTQVAVILTALLEAQRGRALDLPGLAEALAAPDFLALVGDELPACAILGEPVWDWWRAEGQATPNFDVHLRLGHLRDRLKALLRLPEYGVLWRPPYLDPPVMLTTGRSLVWRLVDPRQRLRAYLTSQLLALTTLLSVWPAAGTPLLIFLHELEGAGWVTRLNGFPGARLILSTERVPARTDFSETSSLLLSRLAADDAERMQRHLPGLRAADLRRLPPGRLLLRRGQDLGTVDLVES